MKYALGTVQFGMNYGIQGNGQPVQEKAFEMLDFAINSGIEILDTAMAYGEAETVLGAYFSSHPEQAQKVRVVSKLRPDAFMSDERDRWPQIAVQNAEDSLARLGIRSLAAYLFHNAKYVFDSDAVSAMETVKKRGMAERVGVAIYTPDEAMKALEYPAITAIQIPYNVFDQRLDACGFFDKAKEQNVLVFARSTLLQGLALMDPDDLPDKVSFAADPLRRFQSICDAFDVPPLKAAVGYAGGKQGIDYVVFGVDNLSQLKEYISIRDTVLPEAMTEQIRSAFTDVEERVVNPVLWK